MLATTGSHSQLLTTVQTVIGNGESSPVALVITEENGMADILSVVNLLKIAKKHLVSHYFSCDESVLAGDGTWATAASAAKTNLPTNRITEDKRKATAHNIHIRAPNSGTQAYPLYL